MMKESAKRDFINQMIELVTDEKENLAAEGFTPDGKLTALQEKKTVCDQAEIQQQQAAARAKEATTLANQTLDDAYKAASNMAETISGILGRESEIVKKMRKFRK
nr:hypothetical protein [uncultured Carboxylicivirga sp.]